MDQLSFSELVIIVIVAIELVIVVFALAAMLVVRNRAIRRDASFSAVRKALVDVVTRIGSDSDLGLRAQALTVLATISKDHARRLLTEMAELAGQGKSSIFEDLYAGANLADEARANAASRPWERLRAIREARALSDPARLLHGLVRDEVPDVRLAAFEALCVLGRADEAVVALPAVAGDGRLNRMRSTDALSAATPFPDQQVIALVATSTPEMRQVIVAALGIAKSRAGIDVMVASVTDPDAEVRIQALRALRELADRSALTASLAALKDERWEVRSEATRTCAALGQGGAAEAIAELLDDSAEWVRHNAALGLTRCGPAGIGALRAAAGRGNTAASSALAEARLTVADPAVQPG
jgi:hypothetical protein